MSASDISQQFQSITYTPFSDSNWGIAIPNYLELVTMMNKTLEQMTANLTADYSFQLSVTYQLNRQVQ